MKVLTIDAPWAWAILWGPKRIENRTWRTKHRGPLGIHFGLNKSRDAPAIAFLKNQGLDVPEGASLNCLRGQIHGVVNLVDVVEWERPEARGQGSGLFDEPLRVDPFAFGPQCWILEKPQIFDEEIFAKGQQGLWDYPDPVTS